MKRFSLFSLVILTYISSALLTADVTQNNARFKGTVKVDTLTASQAVVSDASKNLSSLGYGSANTVSTLIQRDGSGNFSAGQAALSSANVSGLTASQAVVTDGSKNLASLAYASANTVSALIQRDGSGNYSAGKANLSSANVSGLTASQAVVTDGSKDLASLAYTSANTNSALVQRDGSGNFSAGVITSSGLSSDSPTLVVDASNHRLGVGTTSPTALLHVKNSTGTAPTFTTGTVGALQNNAANSTSSYLGIVSGNSTGISGVNFGDSDDDNDAAIVYSNSTRAMTISTAATDRIVISNAGLVTLQNSTGLVLPASGSSTLSNYKEGSITPSLKGTSGSAGTFSATQIGHYTQRGRSVTYTIRCDIGAGAGSLGSWTGDIVIDMTGAPTPTFPNTNERYMGSVQYGGLTLTASYTQVASEVTNNGGTARVTISEMGSGQSLRGTPYSGLALGAAFFITGEYTAAQ